MRFNCLLFVSVWLALFSSANASPTTPSHCISGSTLTEQQTIAKDSVYRCHNAQLTIKEEGGWKVLSGGTLELDNVDIKLKKNALGNETEGLMITLEPGATLEVKNSLFNATFSVPMKVGRKGSGNPSIYLIKALKPTTDSITTVTIVDSKFSAKSSESLGLVALYELNDLMAGDFINIARNDGYFTGEFSRNTITGFNSVFLGLDLKNFDITHNNFNHNYGGNIGVSGRNITIDSNKILYPGNGGNGDGITGFSYLRDVRITNNTITHGSCYGMWFLTQNVSNLLVENNRVAKGITGGIHFSESSFAPPNASIKVRDIMVKNNTLIGNQGFGISVDKNMSGITVEENHLIDNHPKYEEEIGVSKASKVSLKNNFLLNHTLDPQSPEQKNTPAKILYF